MKTIILSEEQVKNVIDQILNEQTVPQPTPQIKPIKQFNITNSFGSGQFQLTTTEQIDTVVNEINMIVSKTPNVKYDVVVTSSESKVPNRGVGLKPGELSLKRGQVAVNYIKSKLGEKVNLKINNLGPQGPGWNPASGSDNPQYTKFQYVTISLSVSGGDTTGTDDICSFKFSPKKGTQGLKEKNYVTVNKPLQGKGQLTIDTGSIPDRMVIVNKQQQIVKDSGYVATAPHRYTKFLYVPLYVASLTKLIGSSAVSGSKLITVKVNTFDELMKKILVEPEVIPTQQEMITHGREVSDGVENLKQLFNKGIRTFALYTIVNGGSSLYFDNSTGDTSVIVMSPLGQTGYDITGKC